MPSGNFNRTFRYLEPIDGGTGRAPRMAFYAIAGNEENLRRWEEKLCNEWRLVEKFEENGHEYYRKPTSENTCTSCSRATRRPQGKT